jgi:hypothetical protein
MFPAPSHAVIVGVVNEDGLVRVRLLALRMLQNWRAKAVWLHVSLVTGPPVKATSTLVPACPLFRELGRTDRFFPPQP